MNNSINNTTSNNSIRCLNDIYERLNLLDISLELQDNDNLITKDQNLFQQLMNKTNLHYQSVKVLSEKIKPDGIFLLNKRPFILFFDFTNLEKFEEEFSNISKNIWNFNQSPFVIALDPFSAKDTLEYFTIYNGFDLEPTNKIENNHIFKLKKVSDYQLNDFEYYKLITGQILTKNIFQNTSDKTNTQVDYKLLENIKHARNELQTTTSITEIKLINAVLGKIIYIRYIIDRQITINNLTPSYPLTRQNLTDYYLQDKEKFKLLLDKIKQQFNGNVFEIQDDDYTKLDQKCFDIIRRLLTQDIKKQQPFLFEVYDFSIIPIEFISCLYEDLLQNRQGKGAYYTPICLVDYIINKTVVPFLEGQQESNNGMYHCAVLDPTCGSGIFLVQTLKKILDQYKKQPQEHNALSIEKVNKIVEQNIFGIDKDGSAIDIAIFSIYLTLLDYYGEDFIQQGYFRFPTLKDTNFFVRDYLLDDNVIHEIADTIQQKNTILNFILGNPPWSGKPKNSGMLTKEQKVILSKKLAIDNTKNMTSEICSIFLLQNNLLLKHLNSNVVSAIVIPSSILVNPSEQSFRQQFILEHNLILHVLNLSAVQDILFTNAKKASSLLIYKTLLPDQQNKMKLQNDNIVEYITLKPHSLFKKFQLITIYRDDIKFVSQIKFLQEDCLWNIFATGGSFLDFHLIDRINRNFRTIENVVDNENLTCAVGFLPGEKSPAPVDWINRPLLVRAAIRKPYILDRTEIITFNRTKVRKDRKRAPNLFESTPILLIPKESTGIGYRNGVISKMPKLLFDHHIAGIFANNRTIHSDNILKNLLALINSDLFAYYSFMLLPKDSTRKEESKTSLMSLPFIEDTELITLVNKIEEVLDQPNNDNIIENEALHSKTLQQIEEFITQINARIKTVCNFSPQEKATLDYTLNYTMPLYDEKSQKHITDDSYTDDIILNNYTKIFTDYFEPIYGIGEFKVKILRSPHLILCVFFINSQDTNTNQNIIEDFEDNVLLKQLIAFSVTQITDRFLLIKDIRGFCRYDNNSGFFIAKHNTPRLWQQYNAYLDVSDFVNLMME